MSSFIHERYVNPFAAREGAILGDGGVAAMQARQPPADKPAKSALSVQIGGDHYSTKGIQPVQYIHANGLNFLEGCIVKRITRWRQKNGKEDLLKIKHEIDLLIELEGLDK